MDPYAPIIKYLERNGYKRQGGSVLCPDGKERHPNAALDEHMRTMSNLASLCNGVSASTSAIERISKSLGLTDEAKGV